MNKSFIFLLSILTILIALSLQITLIAGIDEDLITAAKKGDLEAVKELINKGADVNSKTNDGETPLQRAEKIHGAKLKDMTAIIDILKKAGAK